MRGKDIDTIAKAIAAKLGEPGGNKILGCGSASSTRSYECGGGFTCSSTGDRFECGGAGEFDCIYHHFACEYDFSYDSEFDCHGIDNFSCRAYSAS